ncbi:NADH-quinone oxidoreductase subunit L [Bacillus kexueae]|uniref:NADH-quinone oxidoreductase subunit L n=1 Tax=Aeribacillus kexueae TaxID=2078952 RepID=UPI001FAF571A
MMQVAWIIPLFPFVSFILLLLLGKRLKEKSGMVASLLVSLSVLASFFVFYERGSGDTFVREVSWFSIGEVDISVGYQITALNALMLVIVSVISLFVHLYSTAYMKGNERFSIYFAYLGLFTFAMTSLVMTTNILQLYVFWELVGLGSFLLIGFYFEREKAKVAAKKAFIMTRIGDVGLFVAIVLIYLHVGSFSFHELFQRVEKGTLSSSVVTTIALLIFVGAIGKSGQFPLHTWLPDAMEGPTPVSALIHAATMVAAGVYLVAYVYPLFLASETALTVVASVGAFTAIFAATIATAQNDIKRILAYSTISQLGFMMLALGTAGYVAAIFHLTTHAFFKALLFLAAGSVIHIVHTQNIFQMGGVKDVRWTSATFVIGALSLSGIPLFSGFFSKEEIFLSVWESGHYTLFWIAMITAMLTSFYMFRLVFLVFPGEKKDREIRYVESPAMMKWTLGIVAAASILVGFIGHFLSDWLESDFTSAFTHAEGPWWMPVVSTVFSVAGILIAYQLYRPSKAPKESSTNRLLERGYYLDEAYNRTIVAFVKGIAQITSVIDRYVIGGLVATIAQSVVWLGKRGAYAQTGKTQHYGAVAFFGLTILLVIYVWMGGYW